MLVRWHVVLGAGDRRTKVTQQIMKILPSTERRESCPSTDRRGRQPSTAMRRSGVPSTHGGRRAFDTGKNLRVMPRNPGGRREMMRDQKVCENGVSAKRGEHYMFIINEIKVRQMCGYQGMTMKMYGTQRRDGIQRMKEHMYGFQRKRGHMCGFRRTQARRSGRRRRHVVAIQGPVLVQEIEFSQEKTENEKAVI